MKLHKKVSLCDIFVILPHEIIINIFGELNISDIFSVALVNKHLRQHTLDSYLWYILCLRLLGLDYVSEISKKLSTQEKEEILRLNCSNSWKNTLIDKYRPHVFLAKECEILSYNSRPIGNVNSMIKQPYILDDIESSRFGKIVRIPSNVEKDIYFSSLNAVIKDVRPGTYYVVWRMVVHNLTVFQNTKFVTRVMEMNHNREIKRLCYKPQLSDYLDSTFQNGPIDYQLPYKIEIPAGDYENHQNYNVMVSFKSLVGIPWFSPKLDFDFVYLHPCSNKSGHMKRIRIKKIWSIVKDKLLLPTLGH
ncbi:hypothetical protein G9A89_010621 [Geosiphon pyriformis]|nr:hypothetical protein G9A89_010621 [Geosiphon pyriformis]